MTRTVGVVGAGAAGVGAAYALRDADAAVTILEKSRGVSGRAATRRRNGCRYDHGANYVTGGDRTADLLRSLGEDGLADVAAPVWTFDGEGSISAGDPDRADDRKWTWTGGIAQLGERLLARTDATVERGTRVDGLERAADGWWAVAADGTERGPFDALLLTPPAPQTAALLARSKWQNQHLPALREAIGAVPFRTIRTLVLHYPFELDRPYYALVNADRTHDVGWVAREECKPDRVPDGECLLVVQMSPAWSETRFDDPTDEAAADAAALVSALLGDDRLRDPDWVDEQGWRYALPDDGVDPEVVRRGEDDGLFFAGDWVAGEGRVHAALWNGVEVGERIERRLRRR
ncbi:NAD(P)/FAD-dependent oxidoreductase [Halegenticoccus tardaugens]|uniref:NAD(P)/FAD-dependent oxidoreductase n=1 Tax=Halegenticoccus tardaugens TaxID=2071624 RepID=UPI00100BBB44|nr:FAD-dependent oxidoreductase [Halegenticoccus tardaugens]